MVSTQCKNVRDFTARASNFFDYPCNHWLAKDLSNILETERDKKWSFSIHFQIALNSTVFLMDFGLSTQALNQIQFWFFIFHWPSEPISTIMGQRLKTTLQFLHFYMVMSIFCCSDSFEQTSNVMTEVFFTQIFFVFKQFKFFRLKLLAFNTFLFLF